VVSARLSGDQTLPFAAVFELSWRLSVMWQRAWTTIIA